MEKWKSVIGYGGRYEVSSTGKVRSVSREILDSWGRRYLFTGKTRPDHLHPVGYRSINLCNKGRKFRTELVHRLVLEAFVGPCPRGMQCRHLDGDKTNNALSNLRWGTPKENYQDKIKHGMDQYGENGPRAILNEESVKCIRFLHKTTNIPQRRMAKAYGVSPAAINLVIKGVNWSHVRG